MKIKKREKNFQLCDFLFSSPKGGVLQQQKGLHTRDRGFVVVFHSGTSISLVLNLVVMLSAYGVPVRFDMCMYFFWKLTRFFGCLDRGFVLRRRGFPLSSRECRGNDKIVMLILVIDQRMIDCCSSHLNTWGFIYTMDIRLISNPSES
jgi:hypothetical protein